jgi:hypothetical protein
MFVVIRLSGWWRPGGQARWWPQGQWGEPGAKKGRACKSFRKNINYPTGSKGFVKYFFMFFYGIRVKNCKNAPFS